MDVALLAMVAFIVSDLRVPARMFADPDIWWHMACARMVDQTHHFIHMEPFSFTVAGQPWIDPEWLSEMFFWLGFKWAGFLGVYAVAATAICGNIWFIYWRGRRKSRSAAVSFWMSVAAMLLMTVNASARTILFGYLALSVEMLILDRVESGGNPRLLWLLPPLFMIWINLHGSWLIGFAVLVLYIVCGCRSVEKGIFSQAAFSVSQRKRLLAVLAASVVLLFANPYGWRLLWNPLDMQFGQKLNLGSVQEWQPLNLNEVLGKMVVLVLLLMLIANVIRPRKWSIFELMLFLFAWYEALAHVRFTLLAVVLTTPMITADVARAFFPPATEQNTIPVLNGLIAACSFAILALQFVPSNAKLRDGFAEEMPLKTIAMIRPEWRTLNQGYLGGWMDFNGKPTFLDSRFDTFEHHGVLKDFLDIFQVHDSFRLMEKYRVDHVLVDADLPLAYLLEHTTGWVVVAREGKESAACVLFARTAAAPVR